MVVAILEARESGRAGTSSSWETWPGLRKDMPTMARLEDEAQDFMLLCWSACIVEGTILSVLAREAVLKGLF